MEKKSTGLSPDYIIHPGETLHELLGDRSMSQNQLAVRTGFSSKQISDIINGKASITAKFANALENVFGASAQYWLNLQSNYSLEIANQSNKASDAELEILKNLKGILSYLRSLGLVDSGLKKMEQVVFLRRFLSVASLTAIPSLAFNAAFRGQSAVSVDPYVLCAWIRVCEVLAEKEPPVGAICIDQIEKALPYIKSLMHMDINKAIDELKRIFSECGVKFGVVRHITGAPVHGFIERNEYGEMILFLTIRGSYADKFWFTLFHEIAHILNGDVDEKCRFIDYEFTESYQEDRANEYASNILIDPIDYKIFLEQGDFSFTSIRLFSSQQGVLAGTVIGRLQLEQRIPYSWYNDHKLKYKWEQ